METPIQPEQDLVRRAVSGDVDAFGELYILHLNAIYRYIFFRVGERPDAEDLTEQVFLKAWEALPQYKEQGNPFTSWLYRIAHNIVIDHHRRNAIVKANSVHNSENQINSNEKSALHQILEHEGRTELAMAIAQLPEEQQQVIILRFIEGLNHSEVANIIGKNEGTCRMIQHRALVALNKLLSRE